MYNKYLDAGDPTSIFRMKTLPKGSESWNFMTMCRDLVCKYLTWDVGKGEDALFCFYSWDGHPLIDNKHVVGSLKEKLTSRWGRKVSDYITNISMGDHSDWIQKPPEDAELDLVEIEAYNNIIQDRKIKQFDRNDKLIWVGTNNGKYSVKNGYKALINSKRWKDVEIPLKLCSDMIVFQRQASFYCLHFKIGF